MTFFVGLHQPSDAQYFRQCFISVARLRTRRGPFAVRDWILDSGAFSAIHHHGGYPDPPARYAAEIKRWRGNGHLLAAVTEDYMCEPAMLRLTRLGIPEHQALTISRYDALIEEHTGVYILPVLQGYEPAAYVSHLAQYGDRLAPGAWIGVGSLCKRSRHPSTILAVLAAIKTARPDLQLHAFGLKATALLCPEIRQLLHTADSMAWSYAARREGTNQNSWRTARTFADQF